LIKYTKIERDNDGNPLPMNLEPLIYDIKNTTLSNRKWLDSDII